MKKVLLGVALFTMLGSVGCTDMFFKKDIDVDEITDMFNELDKDSSKDSQKTNNKSDKKTSTSNKSSDKYEKYDDFDAAKDPLVDADGLDFDKWTLYVDDVEIDRDYQVPDGAEIKMVFEGVTGYDVIDGMVFPGAYMTVSDLDGNTLLKEEDLFEAYTETGTTEEDGEYVTVYLTTGSPLEIGETYDWYIYVWDKESDGFIDAFVTFDLVA